MLPMAGQLLHGLVCAEACTGGPGGNRVIISSAPAAGSARAGLALGVRLSELLLRREVRNEVVGWTGGRAGEGPDDDLDSDTNFSP